ncbi:SDR family NAD(P)-dependent oxidoreductase [Anaerobacillus sp. 1_MG-2023]|uniref:SDR family NAD(P)-dependent oxidoreductase n=1 Tax=Anaerobacillus sp. 1_MG-2023 TaxID=3062655 RepID=UPI0026E30247|nr:SDR family oxidoreductase [Anaerobacillus sp. 1_MG-2023]MDO6658648.1 SDR family oxidoreductase [Anaerobacillus sp. 1_MG-2023]
MRLREKTVIVTGAAGGMGSTTVRKLLEEGANVLATDLHANVYIDENIEGSLHHVEADLTDEKQVKEVISAASERFGRIDCLVNVAGMAQPATPLEDIPTSFWEKIMAVNTTSVFYMCREVTPFMKKQGSGVIVNVASIATERARPGLSAYIASKGAVVSFTKALAIELADEGIRVNAINPGPSDTGMLGEFTGVNTDALKREAFKKSVPLGELIEPIDIANGVVFLCSEESRMTTGAVFNIDGGRGL